MADSKFYFTKEELQQMRIGPIDPLEVYVKDGQFARADMYIEKNYRITPLIKETIMAMISDWMLYYIVLYNNPAALANIRRYSDHFLKRF